MERIDAKPPVTADNGGGKVICHWYDVEQHRWRDDLTEADYCANVLLGYPQVPSPAQSAADIPGR